MVSDRASSSQNSKIYNIYVKFMDYQIVYLSEDVHGCVKKSQKTPRKEIDLARSRKLEVKNEDAR